MVKEHHVRVYKSEENLAREDQRRTRSPWWRRTRWQLPPTSPRW